MYLGHKVIPLPNYKSLRPTLFPSIPGWVNASGYGLSAPHDLSTAGFQQVTPITGSGYATIPIGSAYSGGGFIASQNNTRYVFETDMVCNDTFAVEIRASNVLFDLAGHTVTFFNRSGLLSPTNFNRCGFWGTNSSRVTGNVEIINGYLLGGKGDLTNADDAPILGNGIGANAIRLEDLYNLPGKTIYYRGLYIDHHARNAGAIAHSNVSDPSVLVEYCTFVDRGNRVWSRESIHCEVFIGQYGNNTEVRYCRFYRPRHAGIRAKYIHNNELWCDGWWTQSCGAYVSSYGGTRIYNNNFYSTGVHPQGVFVRDTNDTQVYNNWIESMYSRFGDQLPSQTAGKDDEQNFATDVTFKFGFDTNFKCYNNTMLSYAKNQCVYHPTRATGGSLPAIADAEARNVYFYKGIGQTEVLNNQFYGNLMGAMSLDNAARAFCLGLSGRGDELTFSDNHLVSNYTHFWLSDEYTGELRNDLTKAVPECQIRNNRVERLGSNSSYRTIRHGTPSGYPQDKITRATIEANDWVNGSWPVTSQFLSPGHTITYIDEPRSVA